MNTKSAGTAFMKLWIIWAAIAGSLIIYVAIPLLLGDSLPQSMESGIPLGTMRTVLLGVGAVTLIGAFFVRKRVLKGEGPYSMDAKAQVPLNASDFMKKYTVAMIVSLALSESVGIYGLVLFLLGDNFTTLCVFIAISAVGMFLFRPKIEDLEELLRKAQGEDAFGR